jgi:hypothetical protein
MHVRLVKYGQVSPVWKTPTFDYYQRRWNLPDLNSGAARSRRSSIGENVPAALADDVPVSAGIALNRPAEQRDRVVRFRPPRR